MRFDGGAVEADAIEVEFAVGGGAGVAPAAVRKFVPFLGTGDITLVAILPEYRANVFFFAAVGQALFTVS